jgi:hypothetical protein
VDAVLPSELDGGFIQSVPHPAAWLPPGGHGAATGPYTFAGVRLDGGTRAGAAARCGCSSRSTRPLPARGYGCRSRCRPAG